MGIILLRIRISTSGNVKTYAHYIQTVWRLNMELRTVAVGSGGLDQGIAGSRIVPTKKIATEYFGTQIFTSSVIHTF